MEKIFTEQIKQSFEDKIKKHHELYPIPLYIRAEYWEYIVSSVFKVPNWIANNHNPNEDMNTEHNGMEKPSLKSGVIKQDIINFSSHRMSQYNTLDEMIEFLDNRTYDSFLFLARDEKIENKYLICYMPSKLWKYSEFNWKPIIGIQKRTKGKQMGWNGVSQDGNVSVNIRFSMSNQLWLDVNRNLLTIIQEIVI